ncbi:HBR004Cp [Eremothecium sinecaudum]|uniref:HBR004Cp n=1 Tax=Eremothecium sinecaudum TaxID=45286 RepID=A0A109UWP4_9SACH|nr:HBR004Cp [Eremothecium sinecaudum]AMD18905.1 HBR004Cp [Eremothecium sinecaudum]
MRDWFERNFLAQKPSGSRLANLETSFDPNISIQKLKSFSLTISEVCHYAFLGSVLIFVFLLYPAPWVLKIFFYSIFLVLFLMPATSQFFFNALPIFTWLALYFTSPSFGSSHRPPIAVKVLPAVETILYGDNLSDILAASTNILLDICAWLPYGIFHFGAPFVVAAILFVFGPPTTLRSFAFAFGYMNLLGVITQHVFPTAPPWYKNIYNLAPAHYGMKGSPGGLARIDQYFGIDLYTTGFSNSAVIFGAFPSLHSGCATMEALFLGYIFPKLRPLFVFYVCWLWWSTMYFTHHYFVDLMAGSVLSYLIFQYTKYYHLPIVGKDLFARWSYSEIKKFNIVQNDPLYQDPSDVENLPVTTQDNDVNLTFEMNSLDEVSTPTPSIFDEMALGSMSRSSANSMDTPDDEQFRASFANKVHKQRYD